MKNIITTQSLIVPNVQFHTYITLLYKPRWTAEHQP